MVLPDSHGIPRAPCYSGTHPTPRPRISPTGLSPSPVPFPTGFGYPQRQCSRPADPDRHAPQPHTRNPCRVSHAHGLASSPFAHHYSGNHSCFLFLRVLRCFTSPRPHQLPYTFRQRRRAITHARFPIRTPTDQRSVGSSPWPIAASHVLHRRLVPRHPPCATLAWPPQKQDARTHYPQIKTQATHPTNTHPPPGACQPGWPRTTPSDTNPTRHTTQQNQCPRTHGCSLRHPTARPPRTQPTHRPHTQRKKHPLTTEPPPTPTHNHAGTRRRPLMSQLAQTTPDTPCTRHTNQPQAP